MNALICVAYTIGGMLLILGVVFVASLRDLRNPKL